MPVSVLGRTPGEGKAAETWGAKAGRLSDPGMMGSLAEEETG